ncbi:GntG family PLP-dependent aldolase [Nocardiopsis sp. RSe5-2]|uniref:GntG family PLP-dependent aldolase n=1 Tax=Nocardiopsis endophytica TaxID=3018445 RepID=A0ABT4U0S9_9ACTN|nr:GntG family PLP-dependent aldolase [Nocardiopsis endophytica]MDA2810109.1 GntG family PLP-dependent aldolase [Nocardiopsis endophytica]
MPATTLEIDLRSDTMTRPTPEMRRAMADAEVGDDVFEEDPTVRALEERTAELLGREAALYTPSAHMANQIAAYLAGRSGDEIWAHELAHILGNEQGGTSVLSRLLPRTFSGPDSTPPQEWLERLIKGTDDVHRAQPALVCMENTFTGRVMALEGQARVSAFAREHGLKAHLDGSRLWNAATALGVSLAEAAAGPDTVTVCFSKGLGAPVGAALVSDRDTIRRARRARKLLGGGMRQAGIIAAGALYALDHHLERLADDHARAERLAASLSAAPGLSAEALTNMVIAKTEPGEAPKLAELAGAHGVGCIAIAEDTVRMVVHLDVSEADIAEAAARITKAAEALAA